MSKVMIQEYLFKKKYIGVIYNRKENAFDVLRLIFALLVIYTHSFVLFTTNKSDIVVTLSKGQIDSATFAVWGFFVISGFLITQSLLASESYLIYFIKRALRIFPAFFISLLLSAIILGPLVSNLNITEYFLGNQGANPFDFIWKNITFNIFGYAWAIRDVFLNNPFPIGINGSMWTLKHEVACYSFLVVLGALGVIKRSFFLLLSTLITLILVILTTGFGIILSNLPETWWILNIVEFPRFLIFLFLFQLGAVFYCYRDKIFFNNFLLFVAVFIIFPLNYFGIIKYWVLLIWPGLVIYLGTCFNENIVKKYGDFSYGVYIYAFPIQQALAFILFGKVNIYIYMLLAYGATLAISALSWRFIEKPALSLKTKFQ